MRSSYWLGCGQARPSLSVDLPDVRPPKVAQLLRRKLHEVDGTARYTPLVEVDSKVIYSEVLHRLETGFPLKKQSRKGEGTVPPLLMSACIDIEHVLKILKSGWL